MRPAAYLVILFLLSSHVYANTDVVTFANGNKLIGEVKSLERGKLSFKTESTGTIEIEWEDVTSLLTEQNFQFEMVDGSLNLGHLGDASESGLLSLQMMGDSSEVPHDLVVMMHKIESDFIDRFDIEARTGYNYSKGSDVAQFNLGLDMEYRTEKRSITMDASSLITNTGEQSTKRNDVTFGFRALRENHWFTGGLLQFQQNEELDIDLRSSVGGGIGRTLLETSNHHLDVLGGFVLSQENLTVEQESERTVEGLIAVDFDWFRFNTPELDIKSALSIYPGITDSGRLRAEFDLRFRWELVRDLFWETEYYYNYDSGRESAEDSINDYGVVTSFGYKF